MALGFQLDGSLFPLAILAKEKDQFINQPCSGEISMLIILALIAIHQFLYLCPYTGQRRLRHDKCIVVKIRNQQPQKLVVNNNGKSIASVIQYCEAFAD